MKKTLIGLSALIATLPALAGPYDPKPADIKLGESGIKFTPTLMTKLSSDSNMFGVDDGYVSSSGDKAVAISATILELTPAGKFWAESGKDKYTATLTVPSKFYLSTSEEFQGDDDLNHTDWTIKGVIHKEFGAKHRIDLDASFGAITEDRSFSTDLGDPNIPPKELGAYDKTEAKITYGFGVEDARLHGDFYVSSTNKDYDPAQVWNATNLEYDELENTKTASANAYGLIGYLKVAPKTDALLEVRGTSLEYENTNPKKIQDFDLTTVLVGVKWNASDKINGTAKVGNQSNAVSVDEEKIDGAAWEIEGNYKPQTYTTLTLNTKKSFGLESQGVEFSDATDTSFSWKQEWSQRWNTTAKVTASQEDLQDGKANLMITKDSTVFDASATYYFRRWCKLNVGASITDKEAEAEGRGVGATDQFAKDVVYISADMSL